MNVTKRDSREQDKFVIRLPDGLRPEIAAVAYRNQRSMNGEIIYRLERSMSLELAISEKEKIISQLLSRIEELEEKFPF